MSWFKDVEAGKPIVVFQLSEQFQKDTHSPKVNLTVGAYRTPECKPWVLPVVKEAEKRIFQDSTLNHEYLPISGLPAYSTGSINLLLGDNHPAIQEGRTGGCQSLGGTGALYLGYCFAKKQLGINHVAVSNPTWGNHKGIGNFLGFNKVHEYRYWDQAKCKLDLNGMLEDLRALPAKTLVVLHACAHNPTGVDPTHEEWAEIAKVMEEKKHFPLFDIAYQGFSTGNVDTDAYPVREFVRLGYEVFAAQSYSKNFGLYNERVGHLAFVTNDASTVPKIVSQLKTIVRETYSNPPSQGCRIVSTVLNNPELKTMWLEHVKTMADRILEMRALLFKKLTEEYKCDGDWQHILTQTGMFCYTGLSKNEVEWLKDQKHIYVMPDGRINMCGLTPDNMDYVAKSFTEVRALKGKL